MKLPTQTKIFNLSHPACSQGCVNLESASRGGRARCCCILPLPSHRSFMAFIAPSLFAADFARLGEALELIKAAGAPMVHLDVLDGHFVPGITAGRPVVKSYPRATDVALGGQLVGLVPDPFAADIC